MLAKQGEGNDGFAVRRDFVEDLLLEIVGNRHFAGGYLGGGCTLEA